MNAQSPDIPNADLAEYYARRAREYEKVYDKPARQADLAALGRGLAELLGGRDVLEIACGTGYWTARIAPAARSVLATDLNEEVLAIARAKSYPPGKVRFARADAYRLDGVEGRFTAALAAFWWSHISRADLRAFLENLHGRLRPGAVVAFLDNRYVEGASTPLSGRVDEAGNTYQLRRLEDGSEHEIIKNFPTAAELREALAGMSEHLRFRRLAYYWLASYQVARNE